MQQTYFLRVFVGYNALGIDRSMDKTLLEHYLSETENVVDTARMRVKRQATVVHVMKLKGEDVAPAVELMTKFEDTVAVLEGIRDFIFAPLDRESSPSPGRGTSTTRRR